MPPVGGIERLADVPIHFADALVRRSPRLQQAADSAAPTARMNAATLAKLGVAAGARVKVGAGVTATVTRPSSMPACPTVGGAHRSGPCRHGGARCDVRQF
jgi:NADH-quinone oxidoreductase subunit G